MGGAVQVVGRRVGFENTISRAGSGDDEQETGDQRGDRRLDLKLKGTLNRVGAIKERRKDEEEDVD